MSTQAVPAAAGVEPSAWSWGVWRRQAVAIMRDELRRNFVTLRGLWIYGLALAPVALVWTHSFVVMARGRSHSLETDTRILAGIFQFFYLKLGIFFGCVGIFTYLFRGEILERSLHYYLLAPVRREVLLLGKFLAGLITACFFFGGSVLLSFIGMYWHFDTATVNRFLWDGPGFGHAVSYLGVALLACLGYGAVFLLLGLRFKNAILPTGVVMLWEGLNLFLPSWLKKASVFFYLRAMCPVDVPTRGPGALLAVSADPPPVWLAVLGLFAFTAAVLFVAARLLRRLEISYGSD